MRKDCEDIDYAHAWEDITQNFVYPTNPPQYSDPMRKCLNCGRVEVLKTTQCGIKEWQVTPVMGDRKLSQVTEVNEKCKQLGNEERLANLKKRVIE